MRLLCTLSLLALVLGDRVSFSEDVSTCALAPRTLLERATSTDVIYNVAFKCDERQTIEDWASREVPAAEADALPLVAAHRQLQLDLMKVCVRARFRAHVRMPHFLDDYVPAFSAPVDVDRTVCSSGNHLFESTAVLNVPVFGTVDVDSECSLHPCAMRCATATALNLPVLMYVFASRLGDVFRQVWHRKNVCTTQQL